MIINLTTGVGGHLVVNADNRPDLAASLMATPEKRVEQVLQLKPEPCSLDMGRSNSGTVMFVNGEVVILTNSLTSFSIFV